MAGKSYFITGGEVLTITRKAQLKRQEKERLALLEIEKHEMAKEERRRNKALNSRNKYLDEIDELLNRIEIIIFRSARKGINPIDINFSFLEDDYHFNTIAIYRASFYSFLFYDFTYLDNFKTFFEVEISQFLISHQFKVDIFNKSGTFENKIKVRISPV